jgi:hypothetical protein
VRPLAALVAVASLLAVSPALAQPGATPPGPPPPAPEPAAAPAPYGHAPPPRRTKHYGTTIALVDGASLAATIFGAYLVVEAAFGGDDTNGGLGVVLMVGGGVGWLVGGPLVHRSEGNGSGAWTSLGLRVGAPLAASLITEAACSRNSECDGMLRALPGVAMLGVMVVDWFVLAETEVAVAPPVYPYAAPTRYGGATFGLVGSF